MKKILILLVALNWSCKKCKHCVAVYDGKVVKETDVCGSNLPKDISTLYLTNKGAMGIKMDCN